MPIRTQGDDGLRKVWLTMGAPSDADVWRRFPGANSIFS